MTASILVVDDVPGMRDVLNRSLAFEGYQVATASSGEEALHRLEEQAFDVIVADIVMPGGLGGLQLLEKSRLLDPRVAVILMTGYATLDTAIAALRSGAADYLEKPFSVDELKLRVQRLLQLREEIWRERVAQRSLQPRPEGQALSGERADAARARPDRHGGARARATSLITGESGTGKELVARALHAAARARDRRRSWPSTAARIPEALLESELFGHERGAFTGADRAQARPASSAADGGTLFLDEIGEMPLGAAGQAAARARRSGSSSRVGGDATPSRSTSASSRRPTATSRARSRRARSARTSTTG